MKVIKPNGEEKVIVNPKFKSDVESLVTRSGINLGKDSGTKINVSLGEMLEICPRERKRADAYNGLVNYMKEEFGVEINITSQKTK